MLRALAFIEAQHGFYLWPAYISTSQNHLADDLSHDNLVAFLLKVPDANKDPNQPSTPLLNLLLDFEADWISLSWRYQFADILKGVLHCQPDAHTTQQ